jgi:hypothetical protein
MNSVPDALASSQTCRLFSVQHECLWNPLCYKTNGWIANTVYVCDGKLQHKYQLSASLARGGGVKVHQHSIFMSLDANNT